MTTLFLLSASFIVSGVVMLWISGYFAGKSSVPLKVVSPQKTEHKDSEAAAVLKREIEALKNENIQLKNSLDEQSSKDDSADTVDEVARLSSELAKVSGEKDRAQFEIDNLKEEIETLNIRIKEGPGRPKPPLPSPGVKPSTESEVFDDIQAQLDMEKVAHQKTKDELVQIKKLAAVKMATSPTFNSSGSSKGGSKFQTMAFSVRSSSGGGGSDILKGALDKVQAEKDKLQSELQRAQKEIQILKMRR
jgi:chromosome segregation ATPase